MDAGYEARKLFDIDRDSGLITDMEIYTSPVSQDHQTLSFDYDGNLESVSNVVNGDTDGTSIKISDGYLTYVHHHKDGLKQGLWMSYYTGDDDEGRPLERVETYVDDVKKGRYVRYWFDGSIDLEGTN